MLTSSEENAAMDGRPYLQPLNNINNGLRGVSAEFIVQQQKFADGMTISLIAMERPRQQNLFAVVPKPF